MAKISDPFAARPALPADPFSQLPPRFYPGTTSPLDDVARDAASLGVSIQSAQEQRRAELLPQQILAGDAAPRYGDRPTPPPYPSTVSIATNPSPGPKPK